VSFQHKSLAAGRWFDFSLAEQLGNLGSEVSRAIRARGNEKQFDAAVERALELFHLTISDPRWRKRLKELTRARESFCAAATGNAEYGTLEDLDRYFFQFACAARSNYVQARELLDDLYQFIDDTFITYILFLDSANHQKFEDIQAKNAIKVIYDDWESFYRKKLEMLLDCTIHGDIWGDLNHIRQSITHRRSIGIDKLKHAKLIKDFSPGQKVILTSEIMEKIREELEKWYTNFLTEHFSLNRKDRSQPG
jgi:hypothetical protein